MVAQCMEDKRTTPLTCSCTCNCMSSEHQTVDLSNKYMTKDFLRCVCNCMSKQFSEIHVKDFLRCMCSCMSKQFSEMHVQLHMQLNVKGAVLLSSIHCSTMAKISQKIFRHVLI